MKTPEGYVLVPVEEARQRLEAAVRKRENGLKMDRARGHSGNPTFATITVNLTDLQAVLAAPRDKALVEEGGVREEELVKLGRNLADELSEARPRRQLTGRAIQMIRGLCDRLSALSTKDMAVSEPDKACGVARNEARPEGVKG